mmetsp:Transcript_17257/g.27915  ORF Transcript_17257/g.27915 Transcript_17257/m.27915 type:complete len:231 (+) Transcript_17257:83-775(+)
MLPFSMQSCSLFSLTQMKFSILFSMLWLPSSFIVLMRPSRAKSGLILISAGFMRLQSSYLCKVPYGCASWNLLGVFVKCTISVMRTMRVQFQAVNPVQCILFVILLRLVRMIVIQSTKALKTNSSFFVQSTHATLAIVRRFASLKKSLRISPCLINLPIFCVAKNQVFFISSQRTEPGVIGMNFCLWQLFPQPKKSKTLYARITARPLHSPIVTSFSSPRTSLLYSRVEQ